MKQGEKKTIIWDQHEPPKDYIWVHDGKAYEYDGQEWQESEYEVADMQWGNSNKRTMICDSNSTPPDNYIWNQDGNLLTCDDGENWEVKVAYKPGKKISSWLIVDHTNFAEARHNQLEDYYNNYPSEAQQDGETWPAFTPSAFPWFVINYPFDGNSKINVYHNNELIFEWKPSAMVIQESGNKVNRTYAILSVPSSEDLNLPEYTETAQGNDVLANPAEFKVYIVEE